MNFAQKTRDHLMTLARNARTYLRHHETVNFGVVYVNPHSVEDIVRFVRRAREMNRRAVRNKLGLI